MGAALIAAAFACPAQPAVIDRWGPKVVHSAVVACHGRQPFVVSRARMAGSEGRRITAVDAAGRRIAWGEIRRAGGRTRLSIVVGRFEGRRVRRVQRRVVLRRPGGLDVVLTSRGELGWLTRGRVLTATLRGPARVVARNAERSNLGLEDDRTLRWFRDTSELLRVAYEDLRPWRGDGCPVRRWFRVLAESPEAVVSRAHYGGDDVVEVIRVCSRATGNDPVVLQLDSPFGHSHSVSRAAVKGPWVVLVHGSTGKGANCTAEGVEILNAVDGTRRSTRAGCHSVHPLLAQEPMVVTATGFPAWILRHSDRSVVVTTRGGSLVELDRAGRDGLTGLTAEGTVVRWRHDGEPRSAVLD